MSLFSGVGGMDLGLERAGIETVLQCDLFDAAHLMELPEEERRELTSYGRDVHGVLERHWPGVERVNDVRNVRFGAAGLGLPTGDLAGEPPEPRAGYGPDAQSGGADMDIPWLHGARDGWIGAGGERDRDRRDGADESARFDREQQHDGGIGLVHFGSPCQDLSLAGRRGGFAGGTRSHLFFEGVRVVSECGPRFALWENVAGALSSNAGRDFHAVLAAFAQLGALDVAWRVLDARHFGVPQRRRRVFVVADFGGERAAEVLFESAGGAGAAQARGAAGEDLAYALTASVRGTGDGHGNVWNSNYLANPLPGHHARNDLDNDSYVVSPTVRTQQRNNSNPVTEASMLITHPTLGISHGVDNLASIAIRTAQTGSNGWGVGTDEQAYTLDGAQGQAVLAGSLGQSPGHHRGAPDLDGHGAYPVDPAGVRRLTPRECERLMGWPDDFTRWTADDREVSDAHRYRMCGNGVVAPVAEWIGHRLVVVADMHS